MPEAAPKVRLAERRTSIPPPLVPAEFQLKVQLVTVGLPLKLSIPPPNPDRCALSVMLSLMTQLVDYRLRACRNWG